MTAPDDPPENRDARSVRAAEAIRRIDGHPWLLAAARAVRKRLPGDERYGDPLSVGGDAPPELVAQRLAAVAFERPSALREVGFSALQVWQSLSESQGRGRGDEELTILFTDLVGFSSWALEVGDDHAVELLRAVAKAAEPEITAQGGRVVKRLGDGLMATFRSPEGGVAAAQAACAAVAALSVAGHSPRMRAGLHVGRPRRLGGDFYGVDVNVAARIAAAAGPGEVLVSDTLRARLGDEGVATRRKWLFSAKGTPADTKVFAVKG